MADAGTAAAFREQVELAMSKVTEIAADCMIAHKYEIIPILVSQQFDEHVDSEGNPLRPYTARYQYQKEQMGASGKTDFELTGDFHEEMNLTTEGEQYMFSSPAMTEKGELKSAWLEEWNGSPIMDLKPDNEALIWPIIQEDFNERMGEIVVLD